MVDIWGTLIDIDGDGIADAIGMDMDGDGIVDTIGLDLDGDGETDIIGVSNDGDDIMDVYLADNDGDGIFETQMYDTNSNGIFDLFVADVEQDGVATEIISHDYDENGVIDDQTIYMDTDGIGGYDVVIHNYASDGGDFMDTSVTYLDMDGDGTPDLKMEDRFLDTDGDQEYDTYFHHVDVDNDGIFDAVEIYDVTMDQGTVALTPLTDDLGAGSSTSIDELGNFDPDTADMDMVTGRPDLAMQEWEFQGDPGRCALFSQKFVIEELTGREVDIEEIVDLAESNGWFVEGSGTPLLDMRNVLDHYGIENEMTFHNHIDDIERILSEGGKVIVSIDADEIWYGEEDTIFSPDQAPNHAVEVIGIDHSDPEQPMVILNDSGSPFGCGEMVPMDVFVDAWEDGNCQLIHAW